MEISINIEDYLSNEEIKAICVEEIANAAKRHLTEDSFKRVLSNIAYYTVFEKINKIVPNYEEEIVKNVEDIIRNKKYQYDVFREKSKYGDPASEGTKIVERTVEARKQDIIDRVNKTIDDFDTEKLVTEAFGKAFDKLAEDFQSIADMLYYLKGKNC